MTAIQLYKFIHENSVEWRYEDCNDGNEQDVLIFPSFYIIEEFGEILSPCIFDDGGIEMRMMEGYFAIWMRDICEYYDIELEEVFDPEKS